MEFELDQVPRKRRYSRGKSQMKYSQFKTIDWMRRKQVSWVHSLETWLLLTVVGIFTGLVASFIDISIAFLSDFKRGICTTNFYLSKDICCQSLVREKDFCIDYKPWSSLLLSSSDTSALSTALDFVWYTTASILLATTSTYLVNSYTKLASGSGISEIKTILGGFLIKDFLSAKVFLIKTVALPLAIGSGMLLGKESALVHLSCCIAGMLFGRFEGYKENYARQISVLSCSSAAGIAVAFGAPIGGVLLSLEGLSTFFPSKTMVRAFFCALIASVTVQVVDPYNGKRILYQVFYTKNWFVFEILFFIIIGTIGGMLGSFFLRAYKYSLDFRYANPVKQIIFIAGLTSSIAYFNIFTRIDGTELLESLFRECNTDEHLGLCESNVKWNLLASLMEAFVVKTLLPVFTYGDMIPGGLFGPVMVSGALAGRIIGEVVQMAHMANPGWFIFGACRSDQFCITPGMYSLLGAMASFSGLTKLSVSLTVIMFELTGTLNYVVPSMITLIVSKYTSDIFERVGILEMIIEMKRYPFLDPRQDHSLLMPVGDKMTELKDLVCIPAKGITLQNLENLLSINVYQGYPVITSSTESNLIGYLDRQEILKAIENAKRAVNEFGPDSLLTFKEEFDNTYKAIGLDASSLVDQTPLSVDPAVTMDFVLDLFQKMGPRYILVKKMGKLVGLLTKKDLLDVIKVTENHEFWIQGRDSNIEREMSVDIPN